MEISWYYITWSCGSHFSYKCDSHLPFPFPPKDASKTDVPEDFDIDMDAPETEKAAVTIQSQFRKFQKKKRDEKS